MKKREPSYSIGGYVNWFSCKTVFHYGKQYRGSSKKLKIELSCDPEIQLQGIYLERNIIQKDKYTPMFREALFTIAKTWQQPKCPLTDEWIKKMCCIYSKEYCSCCSVAQSCPTLCNPMDCSTPGFLVLHSLPEFTQIHVH